jgi:polyisoprenyl-phosphate glycosyltransferase
MNDCYSIVVPVFNNQGSLVRLAEILKEKVFSQFQDKTFELIMVDDGSGDESLKELFEIRNHHIPGIKIIKLTRNFGQLAAILAGYSKATGKCVINISADLQDPPELISEMIQYFENEKYEIVICTRIGRDENFIRRFTSKVFYNLIKSLSFKNMPKGGFDYVLLSDKAKNILLDSQEVNPFWQGQILWTGFKIKYIPYFRLQRPVGKSTWTFGKKLKMLIDGVMSYSYLPIRLMTVLGFLIALIGFIYAIFIVIAKIFGNVPFAGWAPIMVLILVLSGIQMLMLGIIGEYLWRTLDQVRKRPHFIIETIIE